MTDNNNNNNNHNNHKCLLPGGALRDDTKNGCVYTGKNN